MKLKALKETICSDLTIVVLNESKKERHICCYSPEFDKYAEYKVCGIRARYDDELEIAVIK